MASANHEVGVAATATMPLGDWSAGRQLCSELDLACCSASFICRSRMRLASGVIVLMAYSCSGSS